MRRLPTRKDPLRREPRYDVPKKAPGRLRLVQEFLNTGDKEHGREWLDSPGSLRDWLGERSLIASSERIDPRDLKSAVAAREALRELVRANGGSPASAGAVHTLEALAREARVTIRFDRGGDAALDVASTGLAGALGRILTCAAEAAIDGSWSRLKACPNCSWAFYDHSPNRSAKWCSMLLCGNRLKTKRYYHRRTTRGRPPSP